MNKQTILAEARKMVAEIGLINITRESLCERVRVPVGSFPYTYGANFDDLVELLMEQGHIGELVDTTKARAHPKLRRMQLVLVATELAAAVGYLNITREAVAEKANVGAALISSYFTMPELKVAVVRHSVEKENLPVLAQAIINNSPHARGLSERLKIRALKSFATIQ